MYPTVTPPEIINIPAIPGPTIRLVLFPKLSSATALVIFSLPTKSCINDLREAIPKECEDPVMKAKINVCHTSIQFMTSTIVIIMAVNRLKTIVVTNTFFLLNESARVPPMNPSNRRGAQFKAPT